MLPSNRSSFVPTATLGWAPVGEAGTFHTLRVMRAMVNAAKVDPEVIERAVRIIFDEPQHDQLAEITAIFHFVRGRIRYVRDVAGVETLADPRTTLKRLVGDCDDQATLLAALLESVGYSTRFVLGAYASQEFEHVFTQVLLTDGVNSEWINADTIFNVPLGWSAPNPLRLFYEKV
jgi:transglutaminase-like putative cysteine protease